MTGTGAHSVFTRQALAVAGILAALLQSVPAAAETLGQAGDGGVSIWRILASLLLCLVLAVGATFVLKARQGSGQFLPLVMKRNTRLRLVESLRLSHQADLCIVACDGLELLVAISPQRTDLLGSLPFPEGSSAHRPEKQV